MGGQSKISALEPIAVIGSACRFPGGSTSPSKLWSLLSDPRDLLSEIPSERFDPKAFFHPNGEHHGATNVRHSYLLSEDVRYFDSAFFSISPREAESMDPQQRILLEIVYEALEAAGLPFKDMQGSQTGVYVGSMTNDYHDLQLRDMETIPTYTGTGTTRSILSNRISYFFDWKGPSMTIDTACSSSLVAVHQAVQSLRSGESTAALAVGTNLILGPEMYIIESKLHMLSPGGRSRMWDVAADGYGRGEGFAAVMLKTLSAAIRDGDHIECIIRETGVNQDGRTTGITMPSAQSQIALIQDTYRRAGLDLTRREDRPQFFEAHGTGTPAGDPIEAEAVSTAFFGENSSPPGLMDEDVLYVGSVKTVIGHLEGAAGLAGLLKVSLALRNKVVPPNMHMNELNPKLVRFTKHLRVPTTPKAWPTVGGSHVRRASVNSFGFGGTNAHAIVESYEPEISSDRGGGIVEQALLTPFTFSANTDRSLTATIRAFRDYLTTEPAMDMLDLAWTLQARRSALRWRKSFYAANKGRLLAAIEESLQKVEETSAATMGVLPVLSSQDEVARPILGIFTGQGAQWPTMGLELIGSSKVFSDTIGALEESLRQLSDGPSWSLRQELTAAKSESRLSEAEISQPLCTAVQVALVNLVRTAGLSFSTIVGHSSGEIGAAYAAGIISASDAIRIAYYRGVHAKLARGVTGQSGAMMAVGLSFGDSQRLCDQLQMNQRVAVAASNAPSTVTLSGDTDAIQEIKAYLDEQKTFARLLAVDKAYHSHHMQPCAEPYLKSLRECNIQVHKPNANTKWVSSVHCSNSFDVSTLADVYWVENMTKSVLFSQAVELAVEGSGPFGIAIEVGPHPALKGPTTQTIKSISDSSIPYHGLLDRAKSDAEAFSAGLGFVWELLGSSAIDLDRYTRQYMTKSPAMVKSLPNYQWEYEQMYWKESRMSRNFRVRSQPIHELLGVRCPDNIEGSDMRWRNILKVEEIPWLSGHKFQDQILFPGAGHVALALEASKALSAGQEVRLIELDDIEIGKAIVLEEGGPGVEIVFALKRTSSVVADDKNNRITADFACYACSNETTGSMDKCSGGRIILTLGEAADDILPCRPPCKTGMVAVSNDDFNESMEAIGLDYTGLFKGIDSISRTMSSASASTTKPESASSHAETLLVHPAMLDICFQTIIAAFCFPEDGSFWTPYLPTSIGRIRINPSLCTSSKDGKINIDAQIVKRASRHITGDVNAYNTSGQLELQLQGLVCSSFSRATPAMDRLLFSETVWDSDIASGAARYAAETATDDPKELDIVVTNERVAYYYLRTLREKFSSEQIATFEWWFQRLFEFADHLLPVVASGQHHSLEREWANDTYEDIQKLVQKYPDQIDLQLVVEVGENLPAFVHGKLPLLEVMMQDDRLTRLYQEGVGVPAMNAALARMAKQIAHRHPSMRILEIGAGTGGMTKTVLEEIDGAFGSYTFTDISTGFFEKSRDLLHPLAGGKMDFKALDIEKDPAMQGFKLHSYDVIIASNVLHATRKLDQTMANVRKLLRPGGYLLLNEVTGELLRLRFIMSGLPGWWLGEDDGRRHAPTITPVQWDSTLRNAGFSGVDTIKQDFVDSSKHSLSVIVSQATDEMVEFLREPLLSPYMAPDVDDLFIVGGKNLQTRRLVRELAGQLRCWNTEITTVEDIHALSTSHNFTVVCLQDLDSPVLDNMTASKLKDLQHLFSRAKHILYVTQGCKAGNPYSAAVLGLGRTMLFEYPDLKLQFVDVAALADASARSLAEVLLRLVANEFLDPTYFWTAEPEIAYEDGKLQIPRLVPNKILNDKLNSARRLITKHVSVESSQIQVELDENQCRVVREGKSVATLKIASADRVVVHVDYSLANALAVGGGSYLYLCLGTEQSSGRRVIALSDMCASVVPISSSWIFRLPEDTAKSKNLLLSIADRLVSERLLEAVPRGGTLLLHEPQSRLVSTILDEAGKQKVSVVLTTSNNTDKNDQGWISFHLFESLHSVSSMLPSSVDLMVDFTDGDRLGNLIASCMPDFCSTWRSPKIFRAQSRVCTSILSEELLQTVLERACTASIAKARDFAIRSVSIDDIGGALSDLNDPFVVIDWTSKKLKTISIEPTVTSNLFAADKTYILFGLTGELGLSLTAYMVDNGARNIVLTSRNPKVDEAWIEEQRSRGASVKAYANDITVKEDVQSLVSKVRDCMPPIGGVANGAMVLHDRMFVDMDLETWETATRPKIGGSRHLDEIFSHDAHLEFFIMFSSLASVIGNSGQSNYNTGNMYCCGLAENRRNRGLPASVLDIGKVVGIGYVARTSKAVISLRSHKFQPISEPLLHLMFAESVVSGHADSGRKVILSAGLQRRMGLSGEDATPPLWLGNPRFSHTVWETDVIGGDDEAASTSKVSVKQQLETATTLPEVTATLARLFSVKLSVILQLSADAISKTTPLIEIGIDSLIAVEVRSWFLKEVNVDMPVLKILGGDSIQDLCKDAVSRIPWALTLDDTSRSLEHEVDKAATANVVDQAQSADRPESTPSVDGSKASSGEREEWVILSDVSSKLSDSGAPKHDTSVVDDLINAGCSETLLQSPTIDVQEGLKKAPPPVILRSGVLSHAQERMWLAKNYVEDPTTYNVAFAWTLEGRLNIPKFETSVEAVARRHESLRTRFTVDTATGVLSQSVQVSGNIVFEVKNIEKADIHEEFLKFRNCIFSLEDGRTMKIMVLQMSPRLQVFMLCYHHIIMDGVSLRNFLMDLNNAYASAAPLKPVPGQYIDYTLKQKDLIDSGSLSQDILYWKTLFKDIPAPLPLLPFSRVKSRLPSIRYDTYTFKAFVEKDVVARLKEASRKMKATTFHFYSAALEVLLFRLLDGATEDICIGIADANRLDDEYLETVGFFLNLLPVRFKIQGRDKFAEVISRTRSSIYAALGHSKVPFDVILKELNVPRSSYHSPLFQVLLNYTLGVREQTTLAGCQMDMVEIEDASTSSDLVVSIVETPGECTALSFTMPTSLYLSEDCDRLTSLYVDLLDTLSRSPDISVQDFPLFSPSKIDEAIALGRGPRLEFENWEATMLHRVDNMVQRYPENVAVKLGLNRAHLSYRELDGTVKRFAKALINVDVDPGSRIAVLCEPGFNATAALLAVLRVGASYVPLDLRNPLPRLAGMISDSCPSIILCEDSTLNTAVSLAEQDARRVLNVSSIQSSIGKFDRNLAEPDSAAFILYTSGSTGVPKGVVLKHSSWLNQLASITDAYGLGQETVLQQSSCGFDVSIEQTFMALGNGGTLVIVPQGVRGDAVELAKLMLVEGVTYTLGVPSEYSVMLRYGSQYLRKLSAWKYCFCGGEAMTDSLRLEFAGLSLPSLQLVNVYGPTEVTLSCCRGVIPIHMGVSDNNDFCPVGQVLPNYSVYVVDEDYKLLPAGFPGEIVIGGAGTSSGYLKRDELTSEKFIDDKYATDEDKRRGWNKVYKSGDRGRLLNDGSLVFLTRMEGDTQIKLRGQRIELEEIANVVLRAANGTLANVVVSARGQPDTFLVAFVVLSRETREVGIETEDYLKQLRRKLPLPTYMCPAVLVPLENLPLGVTGKADRRAIDAMPLPVDTHRANSTPLTAEEERLGSIWKQVLPHDAASAFEIDGESDFFAVGGSSLLLVRLQAAVQQELGLKIPLVELIQASSLGAMSQRLFSNSAAVAPIDWEHETAVPQVDQKVEELPLSGSSGSVVILTGATGFLGSNILRQLDESEGVAEIHCLAVRQQGSAPRKISVESAKVHVHQGNLSAPRLGLSDVDFAALSSRAHVIIHNGADVSFLKSYHSLHKSNVGSTSELVRLAAPRRIPIHYISTGGVAHLLPHDAEPLAEISVASYPPPTIAPQGYASTKWASERLLEKASEKYDLRVVLHRPTGITGENAPASDIMANLLRFSVKLNTVPVLDGWSGFFDFIPVEDVADQVVSKALCKASCSGFPLVEYVHNCNDEKIPVQQFKAYLERGGGLYGQMEMKEWAQRATEVGMEEMVARYLIEVTAARAASFPKIVRSETASGFGV